MKEKVYFCPHCLGVFDKPTKKVDVKKIYQCTLQGCYKPFKLIDYDRIKRRNFSLYNKEVLEIHIKNLYDLGYSVRGIAQEMYLGSTFVGTFIKKFNLLSDTTKPATRKVDNKIFLDLSFVKAQINFRKPYLRNSIIKRLLALAFSRKAIYHFINNAFYSIERKVVYDKKGEVPPTAIPWHTSYKKLDTFVKQNLAMEYHKKPTYNLRDKKEKELYVYFDDIFWQMVKYLSIKDKNYDITERSEKDYLIETDKVKVLRALKKDVKRKVFTKKILLEYLHNSGLYLNTANFEEMLSKYKLKLSELHNLAMIYKIFIDSNLKNIELIYTFSKNEHTAKYLIRPNENMNDELLKVPLYMFRTSTLIEELKNVVCKEDENSTLYTFIKELTNTNHEK